MKCVSHGIRFTIYPPGFVPYARKPIAPVGTDGSLLVQSENSGNSFKGTLFDAAIDARNKQLWPSESFSGSLNPRFPTQQRHMQRAALLLGLDPATDQVQREQISHILTIPGQVIHDSANLISNQRSCAIMGDGICSLLDEIPLSFSIFERLAHAGAIAGIWARPLLWDRSTHAFRPPLFQIQGTRASPG